MSQPINNILEVRHWLQHNKNSHAFAGNRFSSSEDAVKFAESLYQLGAMAITIDNIFDEAWRIKEEGGPYADTLVVSLPADEKQRLELFKIFNEEAVHEGLEEHVDNGQESIELWWD